MEFLSREEISARFRYTSFAPTRKDPEVNNRWLSEITFRHRRFTGDRDRNNSSSQAGLRIDMSFVSGRLRHGMFLLRNREDAAKEKFTSMGNR